jgi:hypothetical protein
MHRNLPVQPGDGSDGRAPTEAWRFAQAVLGKPIPRIVRPEVKARAERQELEQLARLLPRYAEELRRLQAAEAKAWHDRELLEWAARISTKCADELRALQWKEAEEREAWRRAEKFVESLLAGNWDPSKHPRLGGPPNAGWWATMQGGAQGAGPSSGHMIGASPAIHTTSNGTPAHFAAA